MLYIICIIYTIYTYLKYIITHVKCVKISTTIKMIKNSGNLQCNNEITKWHICM